MTVKTVILVSGVSGSGKSYLAKELSKKYRYPVFELDDLRIALQKILDKESHPELFAFFSTPDFITDFSVEDYISAQRGVARIMAPGIKEIIGKHAYLNEPVIIEGDNLTPEYISGLKSDKVEYIFIDANKQVLETNFGSRDRHGMEKDNTEKLINFSSGYNDYLISFAKSNGYKIVSPKDFGEI